MRSANGFGTEIGPPLVNDLDLNGSGGPGGDLAGGCEALVGGGGGGREGCVRDNANDRDEEDEEGRPGAVPRWLDL